MAKLRARSLVTNLARLDVIADALERLRDGGADDEIREQARGAAHSLAGSAGTFGYLRATQLARSLEALFDDASDDGGGDLGDRGDRAQRGLAHVAALRSELAHPATAEATPASSATGEGPQ